MPTYFARSTKVTLSIANLAKSTDPGPLFHRDAQTKNRLQAATSELSNGTVLKEMPIYTEEDRSHMRFLGEHKDMPFFMVRTEKDQLHSETHGGTYEGSTRASSSASSTSSCDSAALIGSGPAFSSFATSTPKLTTGLDQSLEAPREEEDSTSVTANHRLEERKLTLSDTSQPHPGLAPEPHALTLTVLLSKTSFLRTFDRRLERYITQDVKIDVFFNGELCASTYVPERYRGYVNCQTELTQRFSGRRIARLAQRPWVLVSAEEDGEGSFEKNRRNTDGDGAKQRWKALSEALSVEAGKWGKNSYEELPVIGEYLASLAKLEMPPEVEELQKSGSPNFGVLDVVLISGKGQKDDSSTPYLSEPTRLRAKGFVPATAADIRCDQKPANRRLKVSCSTPTVSVSRQRSRTNADAQITAQKVSPLKRRSSFGTPGGPEEDTFIRPRAPSAAPVAVKRRRSSAVSFNQLPERDATEPKRTMSLYKTLMDNFTGTKPSNSPVSNAYDPLYNPSLASVGAQTLRWSSLPTPVIVLESSLPLSLEGFTDVGGSSNYSAVGEVVASRALPTRPTPREDYPWLTRVIQQFTSTRRESSSATQALPPPPRWTSGRKLLTLNARPLSGKEDDSSTQSPHTALSTPKTPPIAQKRFKGFSPPEDQPKPKRTRVAYRSGFTDKMTLAEEMAAIEALSKEDSLGGSMMMTTRSSFTSTASTTALSTSSASSTPVSITPVSSFDDAEAKGITGIPSFSGKRFTRSKSRGSLLLLPAESTSPSSTAGKSLKSLAAITKLPRPRRRRPAASAATEAAAGAGSSDSLWPTPALSQDCVITYADGLTRQVKTERNGWFEERGVLMGVRYLIG